MVAALPLPEDQRLCLESSRGPSRVCRLRGLPYSATDDEIARFFNEYSLAEVYICRRDGRATGEAYVMFCDAAQASSAMKNCNKKYLGSRYIEMFEAAEADLAAVKKVLEDTHLQGCVVRLRGLPYTATAADVAAFFEGVQLAGEDDAIVFTVTVDGRPTGECYVELADCNAQAAAMSRHKELMGSRYIEIFHSSKMDKLQAQQARLCMPPHVLGRWGMHSMRPMGAMQQRGMPGRQVQPAVLAPAAAAGSKIACGVDQLTTSLQGTHIGSPVAGSMPPMMQQQQQLYPQPFQQPFLQRPMHHQPHIVSIPAAVPSSSIIDSSSSSSNSASTSSFVPSNSRSVAASPAAVQISPIASVPAAGGGFDDAAYFQVSSPAAAAALSQQGGFVVRPAAADFNRSPYAAAPGAAAGPQGGPMLQQQQQLPPHMYYMPMQQGPMPGPYGMPGPVYSMPPGPPQAAAAADQLPPMMAPPGPPRPLLVGGGQWMPGPPPPAHWIPPGWNPAAAAANPAAMSMPACSIGVMQ